MVDARVCALAEEEGQEVCFSRPPLQLVDDAAEQHGLALAGVAFDPEQPALSVAVPSSELGVVEDLAVRFSQEATLGLLDACLVVARIGQVEVLEALRILLVCTPGMTAEVLVDSAI